MSGRLYSVGYEGFEVEALVDRLTSLGITTVVDVRLNPSSRKRGFSGRALNGALQAAGIEYRHERDLGNPPENRASFRSGDGQEGRRRMRELLAADSGPALRRLIESTRDDRVVVMCVEQDPARCHRQVITELIQEIDPSIEVLQIARDYPSAK